MNGIEQALLENDMLFAHEGSLDNLSSITYTVSRIKCGGCISKIKAALAKYELVDLDVDQSSQTVKVTISPNRIEELKPIIKTVLNGLNFPVSHVSVEDEFRQAYEPPNTTSAITYTVSRIKCSGCVSKITLEFEKYKLQDLSIDIPTQTVNVVVSTYQLDELKPILKQSLNDMNFPVSDISLAGDSAKQEYTTPSIWNGTPTSITYVVSRIKCGGCVSKITDAFEQYQLIDLAIEIPSQTVVVSVKPNQLDKLKPILKQALNDMNFPVSNVSVVEPLKNGKPQAKRLGLLKKRSQSRVRSMSVKRRGEYMENNDMDSMESSELINLVIGPDSDVVFAISGMSCASCVNKLESKVSSLAGVAKCSVNLLSQKAKVKYDSKITTVELIESRIKSTGFGSQVLEESTKDKLSASAKFEIDGMTCGSCAALITRHFEKVKVSYTC